LIVFIGLQCLVTAKLLTVGYLLIFSVNETVISIVTIECGTIAAELIT